MQVIQIIASQLCYDHCTMLRRGYDKTVVEKSFGLLITDELRRVKDSCHKAGHKEEENNSVLLLLILFCNILYSPSS